MKRLRLWLLLALLIAVNALVFSGIVLNRAGSADAELTLTERELVINAGSAREENSGLALQLDWRSEFVPGWFGAKKLAELGFDVPPHGSDSAASRVRPLPVEAFVVLEYAGEAWLKYKSQKENELAQLSRKLSRDDVSREQMQRERTQIKADLRVGSRLFAVDVGRNPQKLRSRYPDGSRYIIAPALLRLGYRWQNEQQTPSGTVGAVLVDRLHVPRDTSELLLSLPGRGKPNRGYTYYEPGKIPAPRYEVQVRWGQRYEPWVAGVRVLEGE